MTASRAGDTSAGDARRGSLVLVGFMGSGKSSEARRLDPNAIDVDAEIERREGRTVADIFASEGEAAFRELEESVTLEMLSRGDGRVVALGGGAVCSQAVREALAPHTVAWLDVDAGTAWERVASSVSGVTRPLARDRDRFAELHESRRGLYSEVADAVFRSAPAGAVAEAAPDLETLGRLGAPARMLWAVTDGRGGYPVFVGPGLIGPDEFGLVGGAGEGSARWPADGRAFVVSDRTAWGAIAEGAAPGLAESRLHLVEPGEAGKTLDTAERVLTAMVRAGWTRGDHVVAAGGGMVGDLAGFCAHTYQRGVPVVQVPTTVVGQVDAAYGGKTGVDLPEAKNYVGAYHMPAAVVTDIDTLSTLPHEELAAGFVEVIKTGLLAGGELWQAVRAATPGHEAVSADARLVFECARYKCEVVAVDQRDSGLRQVLNLGHTVGHAIESAAGYGTYRHGEAVGLGLMAALRLSHAPGLREEVEGLLQRWRLPTALGEGGRGGDIGVDEILEALARDKKRVGDEVPFVLLAEPGRPEFGQTVDRSEIVSAIEELYVR